ncbi:hypothetical protein GCM10023063_16380 [Arthrobacter methylotrophus]|uniref:Uncharacterized protein n=2 Tax=Arthrobacter methylotrophus TaxID=121291 RepID=A0ABV5UNG1_9MICC
MVLECAAEVAGPVEPAYKPDTRRLKVTIQEVSTAGFDNAYNDHVDYVTGWNGKTGRRGSAYTPPRNDPDDTTLTATLRGLIGHNVTLRVTKDQFFHLPTIVRVKDSGKAP